MRTKRKSEWPREGSLGESLGSGGLNSLPDYLRAAVCFFASSSLSKSLEKALLTLIHWIVIYPVDGVIHPLNNRALELNGSNVRSRL